jgi:hypothetical protein
MKKQLFISLLLSACAGCRADGLSVDVKAFLKERGAENADLHLIARSPNPAIVPVSFYEKDNAVPSCGVLIAPPRGGKPRYVGIVGSEPDIGFPACIGIPSMTAFRLRGRHYVMVEYQSHETRDEISHGFVYLVEDARAGFVEDHGLDPALPRKIATVPRAQLGSARPLEGIKQARAAAMKLAFPQWRFLDRDFIADTGASFATFENKTSRTCMVAAEAGAAPVSANIADGTAAARCAGVLASTRLATPATTYYLALAGTDTGRQRVGILSIATDGSIRVEQALADALNRAEATRDIKTAKAALAAQLTRQ